MLIPRSSAATIIHPTITFFTPPSLARDMASDVPAANPCHCNVLRLPQNCHRQSVTHSICKQWRGGGRISRRRFKGGNYLNGKGCCIGGRGPPAWGGWRVRCGGVG